MEKLLKIALFMLLGASSVALACPPYDNDTSDCGTMNVKAKVNKDRCTCTANNLSFAGTQSQYLFPGLTSTTTLGVVCPSGGEAQQYDIGLLPSNGHTNGDGWLLKPPTDRIDYQLYKDSLYSIPWGNNLGGNTQIGSSSQTYTVYAKASVPGPVLPVPGDYTDTVTVVLYYH